MKFLHSPRLVSVCGCMRAGMATALCCGLLFLSSPPHLQAQETADNGSDAVEDQVSPGNVEETIDEQSPRREDADADDGQFRRRVEDALNGRPAPPDDSGDQQLDRDQGLGQPYYRDVQGRFFFLDPQGGRVYVEQQRPGMRPQLESRRPQPPQGPELGVIITDSPDGIRIDQVQGASVAAEAGIQPGDVLQTFNGQQLTDPRQLQGLVQSMPPGQSVELTVLRNGEAQALTATFPQGRDGQRYGASRPAMNGDQLQEEVEQLRSEVEALRQQMNRLSGQQGDLDDRQPSAPDPFGAPAEEETPDQTNAELEATQTEAPQTEEEAEPVRPENSEKIDLSTGEAEAETEAEADVEAEEETSDPDPFGGDLDGSSSL